jgi:endonuclease YncB( thermonuclease family)
VTARVDGYGRLLRYVVRVRDGVNVNIRLVAVGAAAPYFYQRRRGRYANRLEYLAKRARAKKLGLWRACPRTRYNPYKDDRYPAIARSRDSAQRFSQAIPSFSRPG